MNTVEGLTSGWTDVQYWATTAFPGGCAVKTEVFNKDKNGAFCFSIDAWASNTTPR